MINPRLLRFLVVGVANTAIGYGIYISLIFVGIGHILAATISFVVGLVVSFTTHGRFVFRSRGLGIYPFVRYVISWLILYLINIGLLEVLVSMGTNNYLAGALLIIPMAVLAFVVMRFIVFPSNAREV